MSNELKASYPAGATLYAVILNASGQVWNTAGTPAFETPAAANWGDYDIALTEQSTTGIYLGNFPTGINTAGVYSYLVFKRAGATPATTDTQTHNPGSIDWTGSAERSGVKLAGDGLDGVTLPDDLITAASIEAGALDGKGDWATADSSGTGARTVTVTVDDGTDELENALVRLTEGANTYTASTSASGVATFSVDDATYSVAITKSGYSFTPTTLTVDGDETITYSMSETTVTPASDPDLSNGTLTCLNGQGQVETGVHIHCQIVKGPGTDGYSYDGAELLEISGANGVVTFEGLIRGARYKVWRGDTGEPRKFTVPDAASFAIEECIGDSEGT